MHDHRTGRKCVACGGELHDSIINFNESLPPVPLNRGIAASERADLHLVLGTLPLVSHTLYSNLTPCVGSSLTVTPAADLPRDTARRGGKLVIVNLQRTPLDDRAHLRIFARTDDVMRQVMTKLAMQIPPFLLRRQLLVKQEATSRGKLVTLSGISDDGLPVTFIKTLAVRDHRIEGEPYQIALKGGDAAELPLRLEFFGHYNEPVLPLTVPLTAAPATTTFDLAYNPLTGEWQTTRRSEPPTSAAS